MFSGVQIFVLFAYLNLDTTKCSISIDMQDVPPSSIYFSNVLRLLYIQYIFEDSATGATLQ